ncbi:MAG: nucleotide exchange factor GrpE [candidate division Zixibacteria bacterium]|nr:nucleotide exchange factor GrpE [candidate division Zixibacteria bacterium]
MSKKKKDDIKATSKDEKEQTPGNESEETSVVVDGESEKVESEQEISEEEKLKAKVAELEDRLLRAGADYDNFKKRMARQFEEIIRSANDRLLTELLEVVDNFERALAHNNNNTDTDSLRQGMELIYTQLNGLLSKYDVEPIEAVGVTFDPNFHEALMQVDSDEHPEGAVAVEVSKGYKLAGRVIRHSKVGVSKGKPEKQTDESDKQS